MSEHSSYVGVDIGGSSIKAGLVSARGEVRFRLRAPLPLEHGRESLLAALDECIEACLAQASTGDVGGIGIAAPGTMDLEAGVILQPFNLPEWEDLPLRQLAAARFERPVILQNDANAAAYGEYWAGAGRGSRSLMFWTLGTGVGGGIVLNGEVLTGAHGHAGECGHTIIQADGGPRSDYGIHGSVELYVGGRALVRRCHEALDAGKTSRLREVSSNITPVEIAAAADQGDELARQLIRETARYLGIATVNVMHTVNPELILIGGAMTFGGAGSPIGELFLGELRRTVRETAFRIPAARTQIEFASLGNDAGFIGAAGCMHRALQASGA